MSVKKDIDFHELTITPEVIHEYCKTHSTPQSEPLALLTKVTREKSNQANMQVGHLEGLLLSTITSLMNASHVIEFGTFTGYSALSFAEALPKTGTVVTLDRDPSATQLAQEYWAKSPHGKKIELILGDANASAQKIAEEISLKKRPQFDIAFIDADKANYKTYWEWAMKLVRPGGAILVDNVLWSGRVLNPQDASDHQINSFNEFAAKDPRVQKVMLPLRDGVLLAQIKSNTPQPLAE